MVRAKIRETIFPKEILSWRKRQPEGKIMAPATFSEIERKAKRRYGIGEKRAAKVAGKAYWQTVKAKFKARRKKIA